MISPVVQERDTELGEELIRAISAAAWDRVASLLHHDLHLRGLTPGMFNEAEGADAIQQAIDIFKLWFYEDDDNLTGVDWCTALPCGEHGRFKLSYGLRGKSPGMVDYYRERQLRDLERDVDWIVEQEAYYEVTGGKISWLIVLCGGYHPGDEVERHRQRELAD